MSQPIFVSEDLTEITEQLLSDFSRITNLPMPEPASTDRLRINAMAYSIWRNNLQINDAIRQNFVAFARGAMLDYLGEQTGTQRLEGEIDDAYRRRLPLRLESFATGATADYYRYHVMSSSADIIDVNVSSPSPGKVIITILSATDTTSDDDLVLAYAAINQENVVALTDMVNVVKAQPIEFNPVLAIEPAPMIAISEAQEKVMQAIYTQLQAWRKLGQDFIPSVLIDVAHNTGAISRIEIDTAYQPLNNHEFPVLASIQVKPL